MSFVVERDKEVQEWNEQKMLKALWRQTVRKPGSIQEKKKPCKMVYLVGENEKKEDEKRKMEELL